MHPDILDRPTIYYHFTYLIRFLNVTPSTPTSLQCSKFAAFLLVYVIWQFGREILLEVWVEMSRIV
jgi:hypothetical protein